MYEIDDAIYCIGGGTCKKNNDDNKKYYEYKELIKNVNFENIKSYKDIENYKKLFFIFNDIVEKNQSIKEQDEITEVCNKLYQNEKLFSELKAQKEKFINMCAFYIKYEIDLYF